MDFKVNVTIDLSDRTYALAHGLLQAAKGAPAPAAPEVAAEPATPQPEAAAAPAPEAPHLTEPPLTAGGLPGVRDAIKLTRMRIEGKDYETNPNKPEVVKYHKALTGMFKRIALEVSGGDKSKGATDRPSALAPEFQVTFVQRLAEIYVNDKGELDIKVPF